MSSNTPNAQGQGIFINGKAKAIEILQGLSPAEREKILRLIRAKNPSMASELNERSLSIADISRLNNHELNLVFNYISAQIMGIALKGVPQDTQRRILTVSPRSYAEEAYQVLVTPMTNEDRDIKRAQEKILQVLVTLIKRQQIKFN